MTVSPRILVVDDDTELRQLFTRLLRDRGGWRVTDAFDGDDALARAIELRPDLVIADYHMPGMNGITLARAIKSHPDLNGTMVMLLSGVANTIERTDGLGDGVDAFILKPVEPNELFASVRALLRLKAANDVARFEAAAAAQAHQDLEKGFDQLLQMLLSLVDLARPGATDRGHRLATAAAAIAERADVATVFRRDLELAARLWEIGELGVARVGADSSSAETAPWHRAVVAHAVLARVDRLNGAASLIESVYENWDGTGHPGRMQRGEIPFRTRLLRVLVDYFGLIDGGMSSAEAVARINDHTGTWYDPALPVLLSAWLDGAPDARINRRFVPVDELHVGLVLAEDLRSTSGAMLLKAGASITPGTLQVIQRRHASDPILTGPYVTV